MAATPALLLTSVSILTFPTGGNPPVDLDLDPADGWLKLANLGGVGAELVLAGGVLNGDLSPLPPVDLGGVLDGDLASLFPADLGGDMLNTLATFSSSLELRPSSAAVFSIAPQTLIHRLRKIPRLSLPSLSDIDSTLSLN